ncbi:polyisoprenoid-binding protein [Helicobacter sp. MIT 05-5293]|uniref:YceI family protein n=1 Tax=Helicobacter sp. MIT 05-5293 TaxID=1548149 RepID=UPI00051D9066|nr:YceI family protein [Helicobacter sp. MIT 05-5293]TLD79921.1 polyisoprenoid-binding protein [Helicobacter sp. MIT 05-5293]
MKKLITLAFFGAICGMPLMAQDYKVDASHSSVGFGVKHMSVSNVKGSFDKFSGKVDVEGKKINALEGEVEITSINTNSNARDKHLIAPDFFDSKKFPKATLKLVKHSGKKLQADVTMRGVTKRVDFNVELNGPVKHPKTGKNIIALTLEGKLNRKDFGIGADTGDMMISDNVDIKIEIEASEA